MQGPDVSFRRGLTLPCPTASRAAWEQSSAATERVRAGLRTGPLFCLRTRIDSSRTLADGTLVRSDRMARLEATLLAIKSATAGRLARLARLVDAAEVRQMIDRLNDSYDRTRSAFRVERTAVGFQLMTRSTLASWLDRLHQRQVRMKLSQPAQETLTIIAYQQPVTRADVEGIRGVQSSDMIRQLIDRGLIRVGGEEDSLGRPFLYETTRTFLDMFGLGRINDLPNYATLVRKCDRPEDMDTGPDEAEIAEDDNDFDEEDVRSDDSAAA